MKWLSDTNSFLCTPKAANPKFSLTGKRRGKRINTFIAQISVGSSTTCHSLTPKRAARRRPGFRKGLKSPRESLAATASAAASFRPQTRPKVAAAGKGTADARAPKRAHPEPPPQQQRGRSDLPARVPVSPVIHVRRTTSAGMGGGWVTKPNPRRPRRALKWGAGARSGADRAGNEAHQMSAGPGYLQPGGNAAGRGCRAVASGRRPG